MVNAPLQINLSARGGNPYGGPTWIGGPPQVRKPGFMEWANGQTPPPGVVPGMQGMPPIHPGDNGDGRYAIPGGGGGGSFHFGGMAHQSHISSAPASGAYNQGQPPPMPGMPQQPMQGGGANFAQSLNPDGSPAPAPMPGTPPPAQFPGFTPDATSGPNFASSPIPGQPVRMANGGILPPGQVAIVGDAKDGPPGPNAEMIHAIPGGGVQVMPNANNAPPSGLPPSVAQYIHQQNSIGAPSQSSQFLQNLGNTVSDFGDAMFNPAGLKNIAKIGGGISSGLDAARGAGEALGSSLFNPAQQQANAAATTAFALKSGKTPEESMPRALGVTPPMLAAPVGPPSSAIQNPVGEQIANQFAKGSQTFTPEPSLAKGPMSLTPPPQAWSDAQLLAYAGQQNTNDRLGYQARDPNAAAFEMGQNTPANFQIPQGPPPVDTSAAHDNAILAQWRTPPPMPGMPSGLSPAAAQGWAEQQTHLAGTRAGRAQLAQTEMGRNADLAREQRRLSGQMTIADLHHEYQQKSQQAQFGHAEAMAEVKSRNAQALNEATNKAKDAREALALKARADGKEVKRDGLYPIPNAELIKGGPTHAMFLNGKQTGMYHASEDGSLVPFDAKPQASKHPVVKEYPVYTADGKPAMDESGKPLKRMGYQHPETGQIMEASMAPGFTLPPEPEKKSWFGMGGTPAKPAATPAAPSFQRQGNQVMMR